MPPLAVVTTLLQDILDPEGLGLVDPRFLPGAADDLAARVRIMPRYLGAGIAALTLVFAAGGYTRMPRERRVARLNAWRTAPLSPLRDFVEFYEKMGTFVYYSHVEHAGASA